MADRRVVVDRIFLHDNGDSSGQGEIYWDIRTNTNVVSLRSRTNAVKHRDGDTISVGDDFVVYGLSGNDTLTVSGTVSEQDGVFSGDDEKGGPFNDEFTSRDNWGLGNHSVRLQDHPLDVTLYYRIEAA